MTRQSLPPKFPGQPAGRGRLLAWALAAWAGLAASEVREARAEPTTLSPPFAWNYGEQETPREAAMGGATRALGTGTTALVQNPANMAASRVYHLQGLVQLTPEAGPRHAYGGLIVDSVTNRLAGGIGVVGGFLDKEGLDRSFLDVRLALALPIGDRLFVGATGRYASVSQDGLGPLGVSPVSGGLVDPSGGREDFVREVTFDAGVTLRATDELHFAFLGQNLTFPENAVLPTMVGGGIGFGSRMVSVEVDGLADLHSYAETTARVGAAAEVLLGGSFPIRGGYKFDQGAAAHAVSAGLGYITREFSLEASARRTVSGPAATQLVFGIAYFLESSGYVRVQRGFDE